MHPEREIGGDEPAGVGDREPATILVASDQSWFMAALDAVLGSTGYRIVRAATRRALMEAAGRGEADIVILDETLEGGDAAELVRSLLDGPLSPDVPVLVHQSSYSDGRGLTEALDAGAWGSVQEPVRSPELAARLRRCLELSRRMREGERREPAADGDRTSLDPETGFLTLPGLMRTLPVLSSLADRRDSPVTYIVLGPTRPEEDGERRRTQVARLCASSVRAADLCGRVDRDDLIIAAYGTSRDEATFLARRLARMVEAEEAASGGGSPLSVGIAELRRDVPPEVEEVRDRDAGAREAVAAGAEGPTTEEIKCLYALAAAQTALKRAREEGGGIRFADVA